MVSFLLFFLNKIDNYNKQHMQTITKKQKQKQNKNKTKTKNGY